MSNLVKQLRMLSEMFPRDLKQKDADNPYSQAANEIERLRRGWNDCANGLDREQHRTGELNAERADLEKRIEELENCVAYVEGHYITDEQIDATVKQINDWKTEDPVYTDYESGWDVLNKLDIERCEGCGGSGRPKYPWKTTKCPGCNGRGWVRK